MAKVTAEEFAAKHARNLKQAIPDMKAGIMRVKTAPTLQAAAQQEKMLAKLTESVNSGRWAGGLRKVSLNDWQDKAANVGTQRVAAGIDAAQPKMVAFAQKLLPAVDAAKAKVDAMPSTTLEDNINRMVTFTREMAGKNFK